MFNNEGRVEEIKVQEIQVEDPICVMEYKVKTKVGYHEGYLLLVKKNQSWLVVTKGKDKLWLLDFGKNRIVEFEKKRKILIQHAKFNSYKINSEEFDNFLGQVTKCHPIILFGVGAHHSQESYDILIECIKHLNKFGYRDLFVEFPYSFTRIYNKYLKTGDYRYYRIIGDEGNFFRRLYEFNVILPSYKQIRIWSIDVDHFNYALIYQIEKYVNKLSGAQLKARILKSLSPFWVQNKEMNIKIMETLENTFEEYKEEIIKETNERNFEEIWKLIKYNRLSSQILKDGSNELREKFLKERFVETYTQLVKKKRKKVIGIFGNWHTAKYTFSWDCSFSKLGEYLAKNYTNQVYSIDILPTEGEIYTSI